MKSDWIGYKWLAREYSIEPVQPFARSSQIGKSRSLTTTDGLTVATYVEAARPEPTLDGHLTFALKHEGIHLEFLARLLSTVQQSNIESWIHREPSGQYARRAGFFFEWLTGETLDFEGVQSGNYVNALPDSDYLVATRPANVSRWRVRNNLPGTPGFCPVVRRTPQLRAAEGYDHQARLNQMEAEFGADVLARASVWLTIKESRASFLIEHEESQADRIKRFASVMERRLGQDSNPLEDDPLASLQREILGSRVLRSGPRQSPVFIGESRLADQLIHYVAPHWDQVPAMLEGLRAFAQVTEGQSSIVRASVLSFGFVYIHPMTDGNGRISRFLVNDTLRRDGATPEPHILPISATITRNVANRAAYDRALERFSKPLMARYRHACTFGQMVECDDGVRTNFQFSEYADARFAWAYPDLTAQSEYLAEVIRETIEIELRSEAGYLVDLRDTRARVKEVIEAPDVEIDRLIRSIRANEGQVSGKLRAEFPILDDETLASAIVAAIVGP